jgi:hypothetical protein
LLLLTLEGDIAICLLLHIVNKAIQKRSHEPIYKTYTKIEAKGLRATTLLSQSWKSDNERGSNREKSNIALAILELIQ